MVLEAPQKLLLKAYNESFFDENFQKNFLIHKLNNKTLDTRWLKEVE